MKRLLPFMLITVALLSCSNEKDAAELAYKKDICKRSIADTEYLSNKILLEIGTPHGRGDSLMIADAKKLTSWRRNFIANPTKRNLLLYVDSIEARYTNYSGVDYQLAGEIRNNKELLKTESDSLIFYNLLYFTSVAENSLVRIISSHLAPGWPSFYFPSYVDKEVYSPQEPVYLTINMYGVYPEGSELDLSGITCTGSESNIDLKPSKIIRSGPNYILIYSPEKSGAYKVGGRIKLKQEGNLESGASISNGFRVE